MTERYPWLNRIEPFLKEQIPEFGTPPPFDWNRFSSVLASHFGVPSLSVQPVNRQRRAGTAILKGLGRNPLISPIDVSPLGSTCFWVMPREESHKLTSWMMNGKRKTKGLSSEILEEGFYRYLLLEALDALQMVEPFPSFSPMLHEEAALPEETSLCIDLEINLDDSSCAGRLVIPHELHRSWIESFSRLESAFDSRSLAAHAEIYVSVASGAVTLSPKEWKSVKLGDFIVFDQEGYDPKKGAGPAYLSAGGIPLFQLKIQQNKIQLLDYASYYEDKYSMDPTHFDEESIDPSEKSKEEKETLVKLKDLPLTLNVELARMKITLKELSKLAPGHVLELPIHPDQPASLTVNGQKVGRGELVHLGEALGIRILELG